MNVFLINRQMKEHLNIALYYLIQKHVEKEVVQEMSYYFNIFSKLIFDEDKNILPKLVEIWKIEEKIKDCSRKLRKESTLNRVKVYGTLDRKAIEDAKKIKNLKEFEKEFTDDLKAKIDSLGRLMALKIKDIGIIKLLDQFFLFKKNHKFPQFFEITLKKIDSLEIQYIELFGEINRIKGQLNEEVTKIGLIKMESLEVNCMDSKLKKELEIFSQTFYKRNFFQNERVKKSYTKNEEKTKILTQFRIFIKEKINFRFSEVQEKEKKLKKIEGDMNELKTFSLSSIISVLDHYDYFMVNSFEKIENQSSNWCYFYINQGYRWVSNSIRSIIKNRESVSVSLKFLDFSSFLRKSNSASEEVFNQIKLDELEDFQKNLGIENDMEFLKKSARVQKFGMFGDYNKEELQSCFQDCLEKVMAYAPESFKMPFLKLIINDKNISFLKEISDKNLLLLSKKLEYFQINKINANIIVHLLNEKNTPFAKSQFLFALFKYDYIESKENMIELNERKRFLKDCMSELVKRPQKKIETSIPKLSKNELINHLKEIEFQMAILEELNQVKSDFELELEFDKINSSLDSYQLSKYSKAIKLKSRK